MCVAYTPVELEGLDIQGQSFILMCLVLRDQLHVVTWLLHLVICTYSSPLRHFNLQVGDLTSW